MKIIVAILTISCIIFSSITVFCNEPEETVKFAGQWPFQSSKSMAVDQDRNIVFMGDGNRISILDIDLNLISILTVTNKGHVGGLFYSATETLLYVACKNDGFCIINVADPENPLKEGVNFAAGELVQISGVQVPLEVNGVYVEDQQAYLACGWAGVKIVNVADPENPSLVVHFLLKGAFGLTYALDLYASGENLWISDIYNGIHFFNVKNPELPVAMYAISLAGAHDLTETDNYLYATSQGNGLHIYDISDPDTPLQAGSYQPGGLEKSVRVDDNFAYVAYAVEGIHIVDISNKSNIFHDPSWKYSETDAISIELAGKNDSLFITDSLIGMQKLDASSKSMISRSGTYDTPADALAIDVQGNYVYVIDDLAGNNPANEGLRVIEISTDNSLQFFLKGFCPTPGMASDIYVSGDYAFVADQEAGLQIVSISDKSTPVIIGSYDTPGNAVSVFAEENFAYVAVGEQGLSIINISDKTNPQLTGQYKNENNFTDIVVSENYAYLAAGENGFEIINISDKSNPEKTGVCDTPGNAENIFIEGEIAYVADGEQGLSIINIADKFNPVIIASYNTNGYSRNISVLSNFAFIADGINGMEVLDISDPEQPLKVNGWSYNTNGIAHDIHSGYFIEDELFVFVADGAGGMIALNITYKDDVKNDDETDDNGGGDNGGGCFIQTMGI